MIKRALFPTIKDHLQKPEITLIVGSRQAGKTTLMLSLKQELDQRGEKTLFLSLDKDLDQPYFKSQESLVRKIKLEIGNKKGYVFIDEIQRKTDAGLYLKGIYDRNLPYKFIISGSGSVELKEKVHESLAGRKRLFELTTLTFTEFVNHKTNYVYKNRPNEFFTVNSIKTDNLLNEYLNFGGYPKVVLAETKEEKQNVITEIYQSYLEKDLANLLNIKKTESLTYLVRILASQTGSLVNISELSSTLGIAVETVKNYLWYLEKTFIIKKLTPFFKNVRKEITKTPIYYFNDLGLKNYAQRQFNPENLQINGHLFENFVFLQMQEQVKLPSSIHFWRTQEKAEVDFVVDEGTNIIPIEVKFTQLEKPEITRSFRSFLTKYQPDKAYVIHLGKLMKKKINKTLIKFVPYYSTNLVLKTTFFKA